MKICYKVKIAVLGDYCTNHDNSHLKKKLHKKLILLIDPVMIKPK